MRTICGSPSHEPLGLFSQSFLAGSAGRLGPLVARLNPGGLNLLRCSGSGTDARLNALPGLIALGNLAHIRLVLGNELAHIGNNFEETAIDGGNNRRPASGS